MSLVPVCLGAAQLNLFLKCQLGRCLPGALPEGLLALKGVDALQSHLDLFVLPKLATSSSQGVAVSDPDNKADEGRGEYEAKVERVVIQCIITTGHIKREMTDAERSANLG